MNRETTPQEKQAHKVDKRYYTASGEDITSVVAPAEEFIDKFCSSAVENSSSMPTLTQRTQAAMLHTVRTVLYENNMRPYDFPWNNPEKSTNTANTSTVEHKDDRGITQVNNSQSIKPTESNPEITEAHYERLAEYKTYQEVVNNIPEKGHEILGKLQGVLSKILSDGLAPNAAKYDVLARLEYKIETAAAPDELNLIRQQILNSEKEIPRPIDAETVIEITQKILNSKLAELRGDTKERCRLEEEASVDMAGIQTLFGLDKSRLLDQLYKELLTRIDIIYSDDGLEVSQKQVALEEFAAVIDKIRVDMMIADEEEITALTRLDQADIPLQYDPDATGRDPDRPIIF